MKKQEDEIRLCAVIAFAMRRDGLGPFTLANAVQVRMRLSLFFDLSREVAASIDCWARLYRLRKVLLAVITSFYVLLSRFRPCQEPEAFCRAPLR